MYITAHSEEVHKKIDQENRADSGEGLHLFGYSYTILFKY